jgi:hypothetical protein
MADVDAGRHWLKSLEEVEPPAQLVTNILVATTGLDTFRLRSTATGRVQASWSERLREWVDMLVSPVIAVARQPRFAMSFGMAFFSLSISLSLAGVKLSDLRHLDLRPTAVRHQYYEASGKVVKYYENIRFVYESESRLREFKRMMAPTEPAPAEKDKNKNKDNSKQEPEEKQERNYSQGENQPVLASAPNDQPVVTLNTDRRFS